MLILLHGDHIEASRKELTNLLQKAVGKDVRRLEGKSIDAATLTQSLESTSLFGGDLLVVIENLLGSFGKKTKSAETLLSIIAKSGNNVDIVLWEDKEVTKTMLSKLGSGVSARLFKLPVVIFEFLDSLRPGGAKQSLMLFQRLVETEAPELIFFMLVKRLRQLIQLADHVTPDGMAPWQAARLTNQAKLFTIEQLLHMHELLIKSDFSLKSGTSPYRISDSIELILMSV